MSEKPPDAALEPPGEDASLATLAWYAEYQRTALLLERLAEDRFPDQAAFDAWIARQMALVFRPSSRPVRGTDGTGDSASEPTEGA